LRSYTKKQQIIQAAESQPESGEFNEEGKSSAATVV